MRTRTFSLLAVGASVVALALPATVSGAVIASGEFGPTQKYTGTGTATVVSGRDGARTIKLSRDFSAPNAIRLVLYLATSPSATKFVNLGTMKASGAQRFSIPTSVSLTKYRYTIAWCIEANEPITQARLR